jgi:hypothetical protein
MQAEIGTHKLTDAAVLDLDVTEAVEALLVGILKEAKGVEETKRGLDTELQLWKDNIQQKKMIGENN